MNKKGFTLIELLTVIAILGILVLLAAPKFLGYTEKANIAKIQTGIKAVETAIDLKSLEDPEFTKDWVVLTPDKLQEINDSGKLIDKKGFIKEDLEGGKNIPLKDLDVKWNSGGEFIINPEDDSVYYYNKDINVSKKPDGSANIPGDNNGDGTGGDDSENTEPPVTEPEITYPIIHENGDKEDEDGTITKPDGTVIKPNGTIVHPNGDVEKDGTITKPDGTVIHPNGDVEKDGTITKPDGTIIHPNGDVEKDGTITKPDGTVIKPDGTVILPDGTVIPPVTSEEHFTWIKDSDGYFTVENPIEKGYYKYTGTGEEVVNIPHVINGTEMTSYYKMFYQSGADVKKVVSTNPNVTKMGYMFSGSQATSLDLSSFDTSKVTTMRSMFRESQATSLDLSSFNTSNVTEMAYMFSNSQATSINVSSFNTSNVMLMTEMFKGSQATSLDLSSFDTSKVANMMSMFYQSKATIGYAKTQADANKFNATDYKPRELKFTTK